MAKPRSKIIDGTIAAITVALLGAIKRMDRRRTANFAGAFMRRIGPLLPEHRIGRDNLRAAFPEKTDAEIERSSPACGTISAGSASSSRISTSSR